MLNGLRIVEIGEGMAVQVAGLMLGELGGEVLKIERPGGDPARGTAPFANWNRCKRSLELDLDTAEGGAELALWTKIPRELITVIQALVILFTGALDYMVRRPVEQVFALLRKGPK